MPNLALITDTELKQTQWVEDIEGTRDLGRMINGARAYTGTSGDWRVVLTTWSSEGVLRADGTARRSDIIQRLLPCQAATAAQRLQAPESVQSSGRIDEGQAVATTATAE